MVILFAAPALYWRVWRTKDIDDLRESPALDVFRLLSAAGADVVFTDPMVPAFRQDDGSMLQSRPASPELWTWADLVIITTDHSAFDYQEMADHAPLILTHVTPRPDTAEVISLYWVNRSDKATGQHTAWNRRSVLKGKRVRNLRMQKHPDTKHDRVTFAEDTDKEKDKEKDKEQPFGNRDVTKADEDVKNARKNGRWLWRIMTG